jgi:hypothetical protein
MEPGAAVWDPLRKVAHGASGLAWELIVTTDLPRRHGRPERQVGRESTARSAGRHSMGWEAVWVTRPSCDSWSSRRLFCVGALRVQSSCHHRCRPDRSTVRSGSDRMTTVPGDDAATAGDGLRGRAGRGGVRGRPEGTPVHLRVPVRRVVAGVPRPTAGWRSRTSSPPWSTLTIVPTWSTHVGTARRSGTTSS